MVCGYSKGKDGKIIYEGSEDFLSPLPVPVSAPITSSSLPSSTLITPKTMNSTINTTEKNRNTKTLLSKRKDTTHDDYEEEDLDEIDNENENDDDDDDENAEDSVAFSKYVRARMNESMKPSKVANFGGEKRFVTASPVSQKVKVQVQGQGQGQNGNEIRFQIAKTENVLSTIFKVRHNLLL